MDGRPQACATERGVDAVLQVAVQVRVERGRGLPVVGPGLRGAEPLRLVVEARDDVRVQRGIQVAEDRVVDAHRARDREHRVAQRRHVGQESGALRAREGIQRGHDRVGQQQAVAGQHLALAEHGPARGESRNESRVAAGAQRVDAAVDGGRHVPRNTKYTAPTMHSAAQR